ncbi:hypothetical protein [Pantoea piersonii]|uniref:hypothetical protein n=1 Tax=Pantoea piersonii TaxID=2364647 RepID=UPI0028AD0D38|nr:hypothetical protein [Pantoea piersonii]
MNYRTPDVLCNANLWFRLKISISRASLAWTKAPRRRDNGYLPEICTINARLLKPVVKVCKNPAQSFTPAVDKRIFLLRLLTTLPRSSGAGRRNNVAIDANSPSMALTL